MQPLDKNTETVIYAYLLGIGIVGALALVRVIQLFFIDTSPDSPEYQRFQRMNGLLFGAITTVTGVVVNCGMAWWSWKAFQGGDVTGARLGALATVFGFVTMLVCGIYLNSVPHRRRLQFGRFRVPVGSSDTAEHGPGEIHDPV